MSPCFLLLSNTEDTVQLQAYRKHTINPLLAPRRSVTEFVSQSNTAFPAAEVNRHSFLRCFCIAQHTWDDDSHKKREVDRRFQTVSARYRSAQGESVTPLNALQIPLNDNTSQYIHLIVGSWWFLLFWRGKPFVQYQVCAANCISIQSADIFICCFPGTAFRDRTGGPRRHWRAPDVLYSHLPQWDCPPWSETLLQHQTWGDGQLFCFKSLFLCIFLQQLSYRLSVQSALQMIDNW